MIPSAQFRPLLTMQTLDHATPNPKPYTFRPLLTLQNDVIFALDVSTSQPDDHGGDHDHDKNSGCRVWRFSCLEVLIPLIWAAAATAISAAFLFRRDASAAALSGPHGLNPSAAAAVAAAAATWVAGWGASRAGAAGSTGGKGGSQRARLLDVAPPQGWGSSFNQGVVCHTET